MKLGKLTVNYKINYASVCLTDISAKVWKSNQPKEAAEKVCNYCEDALARARNLLRKQLKRSVYEISKITFYIFILIKKVSVVCSRRRGSDDPHETVLIGNIKNSFSYKSGNLSCWNTMYNTNTLLFEICCV